MNITSIREITAMLKENGLSPLKKFGQNFLCDENIVNKIAANVTDDDDSFILEIGTGLGALTAALSRRAARVVSVEIDKGLLALHQTTLAGLSNLKIIEGDILKTDILQTGMRYFDGQPFHVCGNLPYYITSKILLHILESAAPVKSITIMVQREVAERLTAKAGDSDYSALTASCNYYGDLEILFGVSRNCFYPVPDVDSSIVRMDLSCPPFPVPRQSYTRVVRTAFGMRRKTIFNNLKQLADADVVNTALASCGIDPKTRAQDISPRLFCELSHFFTMHE